MSIPTDRLREIAELTGVSPSWEEVEAIAAELLACREERDAARETLDDVCQALGADVDSAVAQALMFKEKAGELAAVKRQRDELIRAKTGRNPDESVCCNGIECGCMGVTVREEELHYIDRALLAEQSAPAPQRDELAELKRQRDAIEAMAKGWAATVLDGSLRDSGNYGDSEDWGMQFAEKFCGEALLKALAAEQPKPQQPEVQP